MQAMFITGEVWPRDSMAHFQGPEQRAEPVPRPGKATRHLLGQPPDQAEALRQAGACGRKIKEQAE